MGKTPHFATEKSLQVATHLNGRTRWSCTRPRETASPCWRPARAPERRQALAAPGNSSVRRSGRPSRAATGIRPRPMGLAIGTVGLPNVGKSTLQCPERRKRAGGKLPVRDQGPERRRGPGARRAARSTRGALPPEDDACGARVRRHRGPGARRVEREGQIRLLPSPCFRRLASVALLPSPCSRLPGSASHPVSTSSPSGRPI